MDVSSGVRYDCEHTEELGDVGEVGNPEDDEPLLIGEPDGVAVDDALPPKL
jgi:hypothetical protein